MYNVVGKLIKNIFNLPTDTVYKNWTTSSLYNIFLITGMQIKNGYIERICCIQKEILMIQNFPIYWLNFK